MYMSCTWFHRGRDPICSFIEHVRVALRSPAAEKCQGTSTFCSPLRIPLGETMSQNFFFPALTFAPDRLAFLLFCFQQIDFTLPAHGRSRNTIPVHIPYSACLPRGAHLSSVSSGSIPRTSAARLDQSTLFDDTEEDVIVE